MVQVHQRHKTPIMRASSLISVDSKVKTLFENLCNSEDPASGSNPLLGSSLSNSSPSPDSDEASGVCFTYFCFIRFVLLLYFS